MSCSAQWQTNFPGSGWRWGLGSWLLVYPYGEGVSPWGARFKLRDYPVRIPTLEIDSEFGILFLLPREAIKSTFTSLSWIVDKHKCPHLTIIIAFFYFYYMPPIGKLCYCFLFILHPGIQMLRTGSYRNWHYCRRDKRDTRIIQWLLKFLLWNCRYHFHSSLIGYMKSCGFVLHQESRGVCNNPLTWRVG